MKSSIHTTCHVRQETLHIISEKLYTTANLYQRQSESLQIVDFKRCRQVWRNGKLWNCPKTTQKNYFVRKRSNSTEWSETDDNCGRTPAHDIRTTNQFFYIFAPTLTATPITVLVGTIWDDENLYWRTHGELETSYRYSAGDCVFQFSWTIRDETTSHTIL